jgi:hypothetical protein
MFAVELSYEHGSWVPSVISAFNLTELFSVLRAL